MLSWPSASKVYAEFVDRARASWAVYLGACALAVSPLVWVIHRPSNGVGLRPADAALAAVMGHWAGMFGRQASTPEPLSAAPAEYRLDGTLAFADAPDRGFALIAVGGRSQLVGVGSAVGGARLTAVYADRVELEGSAGRFELAFPRKDGLPAGHRRAALPPPPMPVKALEERIAEATAPFESIVKATPLLDSGRYRGLVVDPNGNAAAFRSLGLHPGDVITSVNGFLLTENSLDLLGEAIRSKQPVKVWVVRADSAGAGVEVNLNTAVLGY